MLNSSLMLAMRTTIVLSMAAITPFGIASEKDPVFSALKNADEKSLQLELERAGTNPTLRKLLNGLITGNSEDTFSAASECVSRATSAGVMQFAFICNHIAGGQYRSRGNIPRWAEIVLWAKRATPTGSLQLGNGYDGQDYEMMASLAPPSWSSNDLGPDGLIVNSINGQPTIEIEIDGRKVRALIDTGFNVALVVKKSVAEQIGAKPVLSGADIFHGQEMTGKRDDDMFLANVKVQSVEVKNIGVVSTHHFAHLEFDAFVGLPFLEQVGKVTFSGDNPSGTRAACVPQRILRSTERSGSQHLMIPVLLKGSGAYAMLDTGMNRAFAINDFTPGAKLPKARIVQSASGDRIIYADDVIEELSVLGVSLGPTSGRRQYSPALPSPTVIGMGAFSGRVVTIDFSKGLACVR